MRRASRAGSNAGIVRESPGGQPLALDAKQLEEELRTLVAPLLERWSVPGCAVGILADEHDYTFGFGVAHQDSRNPVTQGTLFQTGSITKVFTATAILRLVDQWKLDLDRPVKGYLPGFRLLSDEATDEVTARHLLTHTGGFWGDDFSSFGAGDDALAKAVAALGGIRQLTRPGELWSYCNAGFQVLGAILERFGGATYESVVEQQVLRPLGIYNTTFWAHEAITRPVAAGHNTSTTGETTVASPFPITRAMNPAGAIISNVADLLTFARFHMGNGMADQTRLLSPAVLGEMQRFQVPAANLASGWGLGWWYDAVAGSAVIGHGGSTNGFRALLTLVPGQKFAIAVLTNGSNGVAVYRAVEEWALQRFVSLSRPKHEPISMTPEQLTFFAGRYHTPGGESLLEVDGQGLRITSSARNVFTGTESELPVRHCVPISDREFLITDTEMAGQTFDFVFNDDQSIRFRRFGGRLSEKVS